MFEALLCLYAAWLLIICLLLCRHRHPCSHSRAVSLASCDPAARKL